MDESQLRMIEQIEHFFGASAKVTFTAQGDEVQRYAYVSRVLKRIDYPNTTGMTANITSNRSRENLRCLRR